MKLPAVSGLVVSFVLSLLSWMPGPGLAADGLLDGLVFDGVLREAEMSSGGDDDQLVFERGLFLSRACLDYGFGQTRYEAVEKDGVIRFAAIATSDTHGQMEWHGEVRGRQVEAEVVWTKERWYWDIHREYRFSGVMAP